MLAQAQLLHATRAERNRTLPKTANPQKLQLRPDPSQVESPRKKKPQLHMQRDTEKQLCANDSWVKSEWIWVHLHGAGGTCCAKTPLGDNPAVAAKRGGGRMEPRAPRLPWGGGGLQAHEADFLPADFGALGHWGGLSTWASTHGRQRGTQFFAAPCEELQSESHRPTGLARR